MAPRRTEKQDRAWRDPRDIVALWQNSADVGAEDLHFKVVGAFWEVLERLRVTLLVSREYEHLLIALAPGRISPLTSFMSLPHPSGIAVDHDRRAVHVASTRNPNLIVTLEPIQGLMKRADLERPKLSVWPLMPSQLRFFPGCLYLHDLAIVGHKLYGNAVGMNAIVELSETGTFNLSWWPKSIDRRGGPATSQNYLQLNSIAAGPTLEESFFTASSARAGALRPGHAAYPVNKRGVLFSGATREPVVRGLTRPHSARVHRKAVWLANSGYGEFGLVRNDRFEVVQRFSGWTRGLCLVENIAFVGTSRVLPRFSQYAPGLNVETSRCGVHAVDLSSGRVIGSIVWPTGNQVFAIEAIPSAWASTLPSSTGRTSKMIERSLYYAYMR